MRNVCANIIGAANTENIEAVLLTSEVARRFAAGFESSAGAVLITEKKAFLLTDFRYIEAAQALSSDFEVRMTDRTHSYEEIVQETLSAQNISSVGFEDTVMTVSEYKRWQDKLAAKLVPASTVLSDLRVVKSAAEQQNIRAAQRITEQAFDDLIEFIRPGITEKELCAELIGLLYKKGADDLSFAPIVVSGENSSKPHGIPSSRAIRPGDFITFDFGVKYGGYCSDMTRTVALGYATERMKNIYGIVLEAQAAGLEAAKAGAIWRDVDAAARDMIAQAGYGEYFGHSLGHGVGLEIHEAQIRSYDNGELKAGSVVTIEPGIYLPGEFGVRIEDMVFIENDKCEDITHSPKELLIVK